MLTIIGPARPSIPTALAKPCTSIPQWIGNPVSYHKRGKKRSEISNQLELMNNSLLLTKSSSDLQQKSNQSKQKFLAPNPNETQKLKWMKNCIEIKPISCSRTLMQNNMGGRKVLEKCVTCA